MTKSTKIMLWNANGLLPRKLELEQLLNNQAIKVVLVTETHFTKKFKITHSKNYNVYYSNHPSGKAQGGAAIFVSKNIQHYEGEHISTPSIQAATAVIHLHGSPIKLAAVYCPLGSRLDKADLKTCFNGFGYRWIAGGDYNAKHTHWGSRMTTQEDANS
jgi:exonuclease III